MARCARSGPSPATRHARTGSARRPVLGGRARGAAGRGAAAGRPCAPDGGCYGHVDGPRFNTPAEIAQLAACGVVAVSQTGGPETVLCGELELPFALVGFVTDYANEVVPGEPTPVATLIKLMRAARDLRRRAPGRSAAARGIVAGARRNGPALRMSSAAPAVLIMARAPRRGAGAAGAGAADRPRWLRRAAVGADRPDRRVGAGAVSARDPRRARSPRCRARAAPRCVGADAIALFPRTATASRAAWRTRRRACSPAASGRY